MLHVRHDRQAERRGLFAPLQRAACILRGDGRFGRANRLHCVLPVVPMFHANAWGVPYMAVMPGSKIVFPGPHLDGESLCDLFDAEHVTISRGVPTVWLGVLQTLRDESRVAGSFSPACA